MTEPLKEFTISSTATGTKVSELELYIDSKGLKKGKTSTYTTFATRGKITFFSIKTTFPIHENTKEVDKVVQAVVDEYEMDSVVFRKLIRNLVILESQHVQVIEEREPLIPETYELKQELMQLLDYGNFAKEFVKNKGIYYDNSLNWWFWNDVEKCWKLIDETDIMNTVDSIGFKEDTLEAKVKGKILEALKREGRKQKPEELPKTCIQFKDIIVNYMTGEQFPATKAWFALNPIPHALGTEESTPTIDKLFNEWLGTEKSKDLYEICAFAMSNDYFIHRILCFVGSGRNGKGKFLTLLTNLLGRDNVCSSDLDLLINSRFETARLYKKLLCTMGETNFNTISRTNKLKSLTGQDLVGMEFKNKKPFEEVNYAKIMIATNSLPETEDTTEGFWRRWKTIDFEQKFEEKADLLECIPETEYQNLALKCCRILKELRTNCKFSFDGTIEQRRFDYERHSNPVSQFIKDNFDSDENYSMPFFRFYEQYLQFCSLKGIRELSKKALGSKLKDLGYETFDKKIEKIDGSKTTWRFIIGFQEKVGLGKINMKPVDNTDNTDNSSTYPPHVSSQVEQTSVSSVSSVIEVESNQIQDKKKDFRINPEEYGFV